MPTDVSKSISKVKIRESREHFEAGLSFLKNQNPSKAVPELQKATILDPTFKEAKIALSEARESLNWNSYYFCPKCGKFIEPDKEYPQLDIKGFCPRCLTIVPTRKELIINHAEIATKLVLFGVLPILIFFFCGIPYPQHTPPYRISIRWSRLSTGIISALTFTPAVYLFLMLINDPWAYTLGGINWMINSIQNPSLYFLAATAFLFLIMYIYFLLLLTPIMTLHKRGMWRRKKHQKKLFLYTSLYTAFILLIRASSGVFY